MGLTFQDKHRYEKIKIYDIIFNTKVKSGKYLPFVISVEKDSDSTIVEYFSRVTEKIENTIYTSFEFEKVENTEKYVVFEYTNGVLSDSYLEEI